MSPNDLSGGVLVAEEPVLPAFLEATVVAPAPVQQEKTKTPEQIRQEELKARINARKKAVLANNPYHQAVARLQEGELSGVINHKTQGYYYYDMFPPHSAEMKDRLAKELRGIFQLDLSSNLYDLGVEPLKKLLGDGYAGTTYNHARNTMISLFSPKHPYLETLSEAETEAVETNVRGVFKTLMDAKGYRMDNLWLEVHSTAPSTGPNP